MTLPARALTGTGGIWIPRVGVSAKTENDMKTETEAPKQAGKLCYEELGLAFPIRLWQRGPDNFTVCYGLQVRKGLDYTSACTEIGSAILHALCCDGRADNRKRGER